MSFKKTGRRLLRHIQNVNLKNSFAKTRNMAKTVHMQNMIFFKRDLKLQDKIEDLRKMVHSVVMEKLDWISMNGMDLGILPTLEN